VPTRPKWRKIASGAKRVAFRALGYIDLIAPRNHDELIPPAHLRFYYYRTFNTNAFHRACETARVELATRGLRPEHRVLDVGSGIGNLAIGLTGYLRGSYDGLEIHSEAVKWCQSAITPRHPSFRFHHADLSSDAYNPHGAVSPAAYRFPFADKSFDIVFLGSVFTHMLPDSVEHYLHEISRVLAPDGICVASYFLLNDETRAGVQRGDSFMSFTYLHPSGLCRLHDTTVPEAGVALEETFVRRAHDASKLRIRDIRRGRWWTGASDDQDVLTAAAEATSAT
jgi:SAM-dependent methyltransferase